MKAVVRIEKLDVHSTPSGPIVDQFKRGDHLNILSDPKIADTIVWYPVELLSDDPRITTIGWVNGKALNFEHDEDKPLLPAPQHLPEWYEEASPNYYRVVVGVVALIIVIGLSIWALTSIAYPRDLTLPDSVLTPGATVNIPVEEICSKKWGKDRRFVTLAMKAEVFARYGLSGNSDLACVPDTKGRRCEVDHAVSRELAGADVADNLWPQPYGTWPWNAVRKDRVESRLHKELCAGNVTLVDAQWWILRDYRVPYIKYFGEPR